MTGNQDNQKIVWGPLSAPSLDDIEAMALEALKSLPEPFRALSRDLVCVVAEFPSQDVMEDMELETPFDLLGLFEGIGLTEAGDTPATGQMPNRIWLYRRPILDYWAEHTDTLGEIVTHVLIHEIGHHFGLSDDDMYAIDRGER